MASGKPRIAILMAVYEPRMDWLEEQLRSLNEQTYPNLRLYVRDDCSPTVPLEKIADQLKKHITAMPYTLARNEKNLGSNTTFERLTEEAEGTYYAYCDQDDIWLPEKLEFLERELETSGARLACSDMYIIDGNGRQRADSITKVRRHHRFRSGAGLAEGLLISNFVTGCTMLVRSEYAKAAIPFCPYMVHDHYIALCCAAGGEIVTVNKPLIQYRIHGDNQTGLMAGVTDKESYGRVRIDLPLEKIRWLRKHFPYRNALAGPLEEREHWMEARQRNWAGKGGRRAVWQYRRFSPNSSLFELGAKWLPRPAFRWVIGLARDNKI